MENRNSFVRGQLEWAVAAILGLALFGAFTVWGGLPPAERASQFWTQIAILLLAICFFIFIAWYLMAKPLPAKHKNPETIPLSIGTQQVVALIMAGGGLSLVVGPFWDELWHRTYGIPFGQDFFWRPHLLIYFGFGVGVFSGFWGLYYLLRNYKGTFQQRFRTNTLIGLIVLNAAFFMYAVPADPIWHIIYGRDLSSWSVPHIVLLITIAMLMLLATTIHLSSVPITQWRTIFKLRFSDILPLLMFAGITMPWLQILVIDWDRLLGGDPSRLAGRFRPEWLLAANIMATAVFAGILTMRTTRAVGSATLMGLIALGLRYAMIQIFQAESMQFAAWLIALLPYIAIDIWTYYSVYIRKKDPTWMGIWGAVVVAMLLNIFVIRSTYNPEPSNILVYILAIVVTGFGASWLGYQIADMIQSNRAVADETEDVPAEVMPSYMPLVSIGSLAAFVLFVVFFIMTAVPPA